MKQVSITRILCVIAMSILTPVLCQGQSNYGSVNGTIFDPQQQVVPGASLRLTSITTEATRQLASNEHGGYQFTGLLPGEYKLTAEATGFQLQKLMTPGQLVAHLDNLKGVQLVGEEQMNGRTAQKYSYAATTNTQTSAGQVNSQGFVYVDKDTGLPLRAELFAETSNEVQGVKGAKLVAEMRDISTNIDDSLFQIPEGLSKVPPEQVRQQIDAFTNTIAAVVRALLTNMNAPAAATVPSPVASPSIAH